MTQSSLDQKVWDLQVRLESDNSIFYEGKAWQESKGDDIFYFFEYNDTLFEHEYLLPGQSKALLNGRTAYFYNDYIENIPVFEGVRVTQADCVQLIRYHW